MDRKKTPFPGLLTKVSRRGLFAGAGAAGAGLALSPALSLPVLADEDRDNAIFGIRVSPNEIPHVTTLPFGPQKVHFYFPGNVEGGPAATDPFGTQTGGRDPSVVYDFHGVIGQADLNLHGMGTNLETGASEPYGFHTDTRFMRGEFVGTDGRSHQGAFAFI